MDPFTHTLAAKAERFRRAERHSATRRGREAGRPFRSRLREAIAAAPAPSGFLPSTTRNGFGYPQLPAAR